MNITKIIILTVLAWSLIGSIYYLFMFDKVKRRLQNFVLAVIAGPFFWLAMPIATVIGGGTESLYGRFHRWMTKE